MENKKVIFFVVVVILLLILWQLLATDKKEEATKLQEQSSISSENAISLQDLESLRNQQEQLRGAVEELSASKKHSDYGMEKSAIQKIAKVVGGKTGAMLEMASSNVVPVKFFGRVIDQHGRGVVGAQIYMVVGGGGTMAPGTGLTFFTTDADGYFEVNAKGQGVTLGAIQHPELADVYYPNRHDGRKDSALSLEATNQWGEKYNWHSYEDKEYPLEIHVWRVDKFNKVEDGYTFFRPTPGGQSSNRSYRIGIETACQREPKAADEHWSQQKGSWSFTFKPVDGGIQETDDLYLNEAPESGYQAELTISMKRDSPSYQARIYPARHYYYYFTEKGKRVYGSLEAVFEPYSRDKECEVLADFKINHGGSRNLAIRSSR